MAGRELRNGLIVAGLVAAVPLFLWFGPVLFDSVDDRWLDSLGGFRISLPLALGLAALVFARHGMTMHFALVEELEESLREVMAHQPLLSTATPTAVAATRPMAGMGEPRELEESFEEQEASAEAAGPSKGGRFKKAAKNTKDRKVRTAKANARAKVSNEIGRELRRFTPNF